MGNKGESQPKINNQIIFLSKPISSVPGRYISTSGAHGGHPLTPQTTLSITKLTLFSSQGLFYFCWLCRHPHHHHLPNFFMIHSSNLRLLQSMNNSHFILVFKNICRIRTAFYLLKFFILCPFHNTLQGWTVKEFFKCKSIFDCIMQILHFFSLSIFFSLSLARKIRSYRDLIQTSKD